MDGQAAGVAVVAGAAGAAAVDGMPKKMEEAGADDGTGGAEAEAVQDGGEGDAVLNEPIMPHVCVAGEDAFEDAEAGPGDDQPVTSSDTAAATVPPVVAGAPVAKEFKPHELDTESDFVKYGWKEAVNSAVNAAEEDSTTVFLSLAHWNILAQKLTDNFDKTSADAPCLQWANRLRLMKQHVE